MTPADSCGEYSNTARRRRRTKTDPVDGQHRGAAPDLEVSKSTTTPEINAGEEALYTVTISNGTGDVAGTGVDLVDSLPSGLICSKNSDDCEINAGVLSCLDLRSRWVRSSA